MLCDKKYGLTVNTMATKVMPTLLPQTVNPSLNLEQFMILLEVSLLCSFHIEYIRIDEVFFHIHFNRCSKKCWTKSIDSNGISWNWTTYLFPHPTATDRCGISSPLTIWTYSNSTFPIYELISERRPVPRIWHGRIQQVPEEVFERLDVCMLYVFG